MRVLVVSTAGAGHLQPILPFVHALVRRCDEPLLVVPPGVEAMTAGLPCAVRVGAAPPADELADAWRRLAQATRGEASVIGNREIFGRMCTAAMLPAVDAAAAEIAPDLVLRDPCDYASAVVATRRRAPHAQVGVSPAEVEDGSITVVSPALEAYGADLPGRLRASPYLTAFPAALDPSPFPTTWRYRLEAPAAAQLPDWWGGRQDPLVYVTFGSVTGSVASALPIYRVALEAVRELPVRVLLTTGRDVDVAALGDVPDNTHVERWVPQADVFRSAALVVCHGGSGTTFGSLAAGLPLVVVPMFSDQPGNARRVRESGAGLVVRAREDDPAGNWHDERIGTLQPTDAPRLRGAIETVLADHSHRDAARRVAVAMGGAPTVDETIARLEARLTTRGRTARRRPSPPHPE